MPKVSDSVRLSGSQLILCIPNPFSMMLTLLAFAHLLRTIGLNIFRIHLQREFQFLKQTLQLQNSHAWNGLCAVTVVPQRSFQLFPSATDTKPDCVGLLGTKAFLCSPFYFFKEFSFLKQIDLLLLAVPGLHCCALAFSRRLVCLLCGGFSSFGVEALGHARCGPCGAPA